MRIIGITGGIGSGKSRVLSYMQERFSAVVCQADQVAWKLQEPGQKCYQEIVKCFGESILNENGTINRGRLGQVVFGNQEKLFLLNRIMHPAVKEYITDFIIAEQQKGTGCFVLEAALLLEDNYHQICNELWYIYANEEVRRLRLKESRQYTDEKINAIMASQLPEVSFREQCQVVIDNSGDFEDTCYQIEKVMKQ